MSNINTMPKAIYILEHLFWTFASMVYFRCSLFRTIGSCSLTESKIILWIIVVISEIIGISLTLSKRRNDLSVFVTIITPYELYFIISYIKNIPWIILFTCIAAVFLSILYTILTLMQKIQKNANKKTIITRRLFHSFLCSRTITSFCLAFAFIPPLLNGLLGNSLFSSNVLPEKSYKDSKWTISNNIDYILNFREEVWQNLSTTKKLDTLQVAANIESNYFGLPHELNVILGTLDENIIACYNDKNYTVTFNIDYFDSGSGMDALNTICHEAYHAYQHSLCDAYDNIDNQYKNLIVFNDVPNYKYEFKNYNNGIGGYMEYYTQSCESDARSYANDAVNDYYRKISAYLSLADKESSRTEEETS